MYLLAEVAADLAEEVAEIQEIADKMDMEHLTGFVLVMLILAIMWGLTALMGKLFTLIDKAAQLDKAQAAKSLAAATPAAPVPSTGLAEEDLVVISATVATLLRDKAYRIISIKGQGNEWSKEGRRQHFSSHKIR